MRFEVCDSSVDYKHDKSKSASTRGLIKRKAVKWRAIFVQLIILFVENYPLLKGAKIMTRL